jgi:hypothetical protein
MRAAKTARFNFVILSERRIRESKELNEQLG